ncbi:MAG: hypothetical protein M1831_006617 [Alyxoria varia]|nr:MAG: hypothetical protein M1831_006617 [Alyxoria varia]
MARSRNPNPKRQTRTSFPHAHHEHYQKNPSTSKSTSTDAPSSTRSSQKSFNRRKRSRNLDAFAIASEENPERLGVRESRLGHNDDAEEEEKRRFAKRRRVDEGDDDDQGEEEFGGGGDSDDGDGTEADLPRWREGSVDDDDDEEVDSDEAFGSEDENQFEGFAFRGSRGKKGAGKGRGKQEQAKTKAPVDGAKGGHVPNEEEAFDLNEDELSKDEGEESDGSLGSDAVDLADVLDGNESQDEEETLKSEHGKSGGSAEVGVSSEDAFSDFDNDDEPPGSAKRDQSTSRGTPASSHKLDDLSDDDDLGSSGSEPENDHADPSKHAQLNEIWDMIQESGKGNKRVRDQNRAESLAFLGPSVSRVNDNKIETVTPYLPKRQQDKESRVAAYGEAKKTLDRWLDTVKRNREADHLYFPLKDPDAHGAQGLNKMLPPDTTITKSTKKSSSNDLESAIQGILKESGFGVEDEKIREAEELQEKKMPMEEVLARRAELRKARDLLFREEHRAKRINKIKSKAYRRAHRRDKEKAAQQERNMMVAAGLELSEDEREENDRRRAAERMGARHKESRWAKNVKSTGRMTWDDEARSGVEDMARRNEELRRRMEGQSIRQEGDEGDESDDESAMESAEEDEDAMREKLSKQVDEVDSSEQISGSGSRLMSLGFMQKAEEQRRKQNAEAVEGLRRELAGEESPDESETDAPVGRRTFGLSKLQEQPGQQSKRKGKLNEFEEGSASENEGDHIEVSTHEAEPEGKAMHNPRGGLPKQEQRPPLKSALKKGAQLAEQPFPKAKTQEPSHQIDSQSPEKQTGKKLQESPRGHLPPPNHNQFTHVPHPALQDSNTEKDSKSLPQPQESASDDEQNDDAEFALKTTNEALVAAAFGGEEDAVAEGDFSREKRKAAEEEDDQIVDETLPGWGSWVGAGISQKKSKRQKKHQQQKRQQQAAEENKAKNRFQKKVQDGVKPADRRDARLENVILSEKRIKKNAKYLANSLPHPFESKTQYERSLRMPMGPEWTTKESFQGMTKPRVMVKQGIIQPMAKPMV